MKEKNPDQDLQTRHPNSAYGEEQQRRKMYCLLQTCTLLLISTKQIIEHVSILNSFCQPVFSYVEVIKLGTTFSDYWPMKNIYN